jgi:NDP-sugar pyrophosphorylase family protein
MHNNLIILAGGASSRMKKSLASDNLSEEEIIAANSVSKALIGLGKDNRPILDYLLFNAEKAGFKNIFLVVGESSDSFKKYYGDTSKNTFNNLELHFATQYIPKGRIKPFGTADALSQALHQYPHLQNETFTVCNSDNLYSVEVFKALRKNKNMNAFISYDRDGLLFTMERISRFALVLLDNQNYVCDIIEKPSEEKIEAYRDHQGKFRVSMNIFKLNGNEIYPYLLHCPVHLERDEKELPLAILNLCKVNPKALKGIPFKEHVPDLTSKEDIEILKKYIEDHFSS